MRGAAITGAAFFAAMGAPATGGGDGVHEFTSLNCSTACTATCICSEKSSVFGGGLRGIGLHAALSIAPNGFGLLKLRNQKSFCWSVVQEVANGPRSAAT